MAFRGDIAALFRESRGVLSRHLGRRMLEQQDTGIEGDGAREPRAKHIGGIQLGNRPIERRFSKPDVPRQPYGAFPNVL